MTTTITRAKRYTKPTEPRNFEITPRVLQINAEICRAEAIRFDYLRLLFPDMADHVLYRITQLLFENDFSNRPRAQENAHKQVPGRLPTYITKDRWGVRLHNAFFADPVAVPKYTYRPEPIAETDDLDDHIHQKDKHQLSWGHLRHEIRKTRSVLSYRVGARTVLNLEHLTQSDLWCRFANNSQLIKPAYNIANYPRIMAHDFKAATPTNQSSAAKVPLQLKTTIDWSVKLPGNSQLSTLSIPVSTQPDDYFAHVGKRGLSPFFFEHDEGTETILPGAAQRHSLHLFRETSLFQKYLIYLSAFRKREHQKQFGITAFNVLTVTTTPQRVDQIIERLWPHLRQLNIHPTFFLFTDMQTLAKHGNNPYSPGLEHKAMDGRHVHLLDI